LAGNLKEREKRKGGRQPNAETFLLLSVTQPGPDIEDCQFPLNAIAFFWLLAIHDGQLSTPTGNMGN
jgi:hypothetical protein